ncbi:acyltransferase family protein [Pseudoduganella danionis]|uniref:Acyltransferase family protein n=1 Tax=Pseudoduganella danionis TaxID=1890295 RepID=A0ABW9SHX9_9BURK|nr:acyltransferase [Pseudoduganella danionis]MTW31688.1 acyltransferase family protein [Pseudoduganella danionis]
MNSSNLPYNPRLDQLRWLAATIVFLFHFYLEYRGQGGVQITNDWLGLISEGHTGVALFFTLSGFLFMQIAQYQQQIDYREFLRNRCLRILPLFLTIFAVALSIGRDKFTPQDLLYLFATNLGLAPTSYTPITGAAWSISVEFWFYLVFPFLARFTLQYGARYLLKLLALMLFFKVASYTVNEKSTLMYFSTMVGRFDQFLVGMLAAVLYQRHSGWIQRYVGWLLPLAALLVVADSALQSHVAKFEPYTHRPFWIVWSLLESIGWSTLIMAWVAYKRPLPNWLDRTLGQGGRISFSFYLLHMGVLHVWMQYVGLPAITTNHWINTSVALIATYAVTWLLSTLCYSAVEQPFLALRRSYGTRNVAV